MVSILPLAALPAVPRAAQVRQGLHLERALPRRQAQLNLAVPHAGEGPSGEAALRVAVGFAATLGVGAAALSAGRHSSRGLRHRRATACTRVSRAAAKKEADEYFPVNILQGDNKMSFEIRGKDKVGVLKNMFQMTNAVPVEKQELSFAGMVLDDDTTVMECGIEEGSTLTLTFEEEPEDEAGKEAPRPETIDGEPCIRVYVSCDVSVNKEMRVPVDAKLSQTVREAKLAAFKEFVAEQRSMGAGTNRLNDFGLFDIKHGPVRQPDGNFRQLKRDERVRDKLTVEESGLKDGQELAFIILVYAE